MVKAPAGKPTAPAAPSAAFPATLPSHWSTGLATSPAGPPELAYTQVRISPSLCNLATHTSASRYCFACHKCPGDYLI